MSDTHTNTKAKKSKASNQHSDIYDLMRDLVKDNPGLNPPKLIRKWLDIVRDDPNMCESAIELAGRFVYNSVLAKKPARDREKETERTRKRIASSMFSMVMPNGKTLGKCTFGELAKHNKGFGRLAKLGKPHQIIEDTITEAQARKAVLG
jgi:hypothetical protein